MSVAGLPPLSGFVGKAMLLKAADAGGYAPYFWAAVLMGSLASLTALSRSGSTLFWRMDTVWRAENSSAECPTADSWSVVIILLLFATGPALVIWGDAVMQYCQALAQQVLVPSHYIFAVMSHLTAGGELQ
mgnify:CR=1 FL=1